MSFILDALRRSENERKRNLGPSLADVRVVRRTADRPWWIVAVIGLLVINLCVLLFVLLTRTLQPEPAPRAAESTPPANADSNASAPAPRSASNTPAPAAPRPQAASPSVRSLADEASIVELDPAAPYSPDVAAASYVPERPPVVQAIRPNASAASPAISAPQEPREMLPTHADLSASGVALPDLHLDIHVHSPNAAERFVFINMRKYVEGQTLTEGPAVERITPDGVVLNQRGLRFLLPRQ